MANFEKEKARLEGILEVGKFVPVTDHFDGLSTCIVMTHRTRFHDDSNYICGCKFKNKFLRFIVIPTETPDSYELTAKDGKSYMPKDRESIQDFANDGIGDIIEFLTRDGEGELFVLVPGNDTERDVFTQRKILYNK